MPLTLVFLDQVRGFYFSIWDTDEWRSEQMEKESEQTPSQSEQTKG